MLSAAARSGGRVCDGRIPPLTAANTGPPLLISLPASEVPGPGAVAAERPSWQARLMTDDLAVAEPRESADGGSGQLGN
jgi:hypothetical protein